MEKLEKKLEKFLLKYDKYFDDSLKDFVRNHFDEYLNGENKIDLLAQIAYAIGERPINGSIYEEYFAFLKSNYNLNSDILEIGCGFYPAFSDMVDKYQKEKNIGTIEAYDPNLVITRKGSIKLHKKLFESIKNKKYSLITSIFPCEATFKIIDESEKNNCDFSILLCDCIPEEERISMPFYQSSGMWHNRVYRYAKETMKNRIIEIEHIEQIEQPIIYTKRKI